MSWAFFQFFVSSFLVTFCVMSGLLYSLPKYYICFHYDPSNQPTRITTNKQIKKSYFIILIFKNKTIQYFFLMSDWIFIKGMFFSLSTLHRFFCSQVGSWFFTYENNAEKICVCSLFSICFLQNLNLGTIHGSPIFYDDCKVTIAILYLCILSTNTKSYTYVL